MNQSDKDAVDGSVEAASGEPGSIHVHVTRVTGENRERQARSAEVEVIENHGGGHRRRRAGYNCHRVGRGSSASSICRPPDQRAFADGELNPPEPTATRCNAPPRSIARSCEIQGDRNHHHAGAQPPHSPGCFDQE